MYLLYTGNVNHPDQDPDHEQHQALAFSTNGINVTKYEGNPVIEAPEHQPNIRDPKVWKHGNSYYMVLGNSFNNGTLGRVLLYASKDLISWEQKSILAESDGFLGYMWECPDFFELNGKFVLLFSPQGVKPQGDKYRNLYQTGYIVGNFDYDSYKFTPITEFVELDNGHDFYATQTILDPYNRRLLVAWFDMWEEVYPERDDGWTGQMTIVRKLTLSKDNKLLQKPVTEVQSARGELLYSAMKTRGSKRVVLKDRTGEINVKAKASQNVTIYIGSESDASKLTTVTYDAKNGIVRLDRGGDDGVRQTEWKPKGRFNLRIFIDASSVEVFWGNEVTFSSRIFLPGKVDVRLAPGTEVEHMSVAALKRTIQKPQ